MEEFIGVVRQHPCLWNPLHPDYRDIHAKVQAWQIVVKQINNSTIPNIKVARSEWRKLRDNHREALRRAKLGQNRLLPPQITTWKYAKAMQFLEPYSKYRITENIESDSEPSSEHTIKSSNSDVSVADVSENGHSESVEGRNKRHCTEYSRDYVSYKPVYEVDALESFFNCILTSTREMPPWMQTQVKKKIFSVIIDAEESLTSQEADVDKSYVNAIDVTKIKTEMDI